VKTIVLMLSLILITTVSYGQTRSDLVVKRISNFVAKNMMRFGSESSVHYNRMEKVLQIGGGQIPIFDVKFSYFYIDQSDTPKHHLVLINCKNGENCLILNSAVNNQLLDSVALTFKTKEGCYAFMNLISELRETH
jgi:hypothetical protein